MIAHEATVVREAAESGAFRAVCVCGYVTGWFDDQDLLEADWVASHWPWFEPMSAEERTRYALYDDPDHVDKVITGDQALSTWGDEVL